MVAWSVKASNLQSVEVCTSALGGSNPALGMVYQLFSSRNTAPQTYPTFDPDQNLP